MGSCIAVSGDDEGQIVATPVSKSLPPIVMPDFGKWKDDILDIVSRSIAVLPAHTDVPRLCKKMTVTNGDQVLFDGSVDSLKDTSNTQVTKQLFAKSIGDKEFLELLDNSYDKTVVGAGDIGQHLGAWFAHVTKSLGLEPPTLIIFKTVHQRCIFPAFYCMRDLLQNDFGKFKDKRGTWSVRIDITENVTVYHVKRQESVNFTGTETDFEFDWQLTLPLGQGQKLDKDGLCIQLSGLACNLNLDKEKGDLIQKVYKQHQKIN